MVSSALSGGAVFGGAGNAYLWGGLAALFAGLALGQGFRWLRGTRGWKGPTKADFHGSGRRSPSLAPTLAHIFLSLSVLALTALLVFGPQGFWKADYFGLWCPFAFLFGLALCLAPRFIGLPALALLLASELLLLDGLRGWIPLEGNETVAYYLPLSVTDTRCMGELGVYERDGLPTAQRLEFAADEASLVVERVELKGPALLMAYPNYYRIVGMAGKDGETLASFQARKNILDFLEPLKADGSRRGSLVRRWREKSPPAPLLPLARLEFGFARGGVEPGGADGEALRLAVSLQ
jgi:hypothetical protein